MLMNANKGISIVEENMIVILSIRMSHIEMEESHVELALKSFATPIHIPEESGPLLYVGLFVTNEKEEDDWRLTTIIWTSKMQW